MWFKAICGTLVLLSMGCEGVKKYSQEGLNFDIENRSVGTSTRLKIRPKGPFRFNLKGTNQASLKNRATVFSKIAETELVLDLPSKLDSNLVLDLYTCEKNQTFCQEQRADVSPEANGVDLVVKRVEIPQVACQTQLVAPEMDRDGFFRNNVNLALARAQKLNQLVIMEFSAVWSPACLRLNEEVISNEEFKTTAAQFSKVKIDSDWEGSAEFRNKYLILDVPTILIVNSTGSEVARFRGFRPKNQLIAELNEVLSQTPPSIEELQTRANAGDLSAKEKLGLNSYTSLQMTAASILLAPIPNQVERYLLAQLYLLEDNQSNPKWAEQRDLLARLVADFPASPDTPKRWLKLATVEKALGHLQAMKAAGAQALATADLYIKEPQRWTGKTSLDPSRDDFEIDLHEYWAVKADTYDLLGQSNLAQFAWNSAITRLSKIQKSTGQGLMLAKYLKRAHKEAEIQPLLERLEKKNPDNYVFPYRLANIELKNGNFTKAELLARQAMDKSYGANALQAALLFVEILKAQNRGAEARSVARFTLDKIRKPTDATSLMARQVEVLENLVKTF